MNKMSTPAVPARNFQILRKISFEFQVTPLLPSQEYLILGSNAARAISVRRFTITIRIAKLTIAA